ncbi:phosphate-starvation-inducible PsiE family protein, partial [Sphingomonas koreensis]|uniref:phosphate-starvation-inducible PsiE family protein n=1 Tax=Sphingomonas koreensis TaxID=93064 RepID=UPI002407D9BD
MNVNRKTSFQILLDEWRLLNFYGRFEQVVALILSAVIAVIIVVSLIQLIGAVFTLLIMGGFNPIDHRIFQSVFGMVMNLLIAVRRQNIRHNSRRRLAECGPRQGVDVRRRTCGAASADVRWSVA